MKVFDFNDYRDFIRARVESSPKKGHGQYRKIAEFLDIPTSLVSQIMSGIRELSLESASLMTEYFALSDLETDYFLNLVELARAGNPSLRSKLQRRLKEAQEKGLQINQRISHEKSLSEQESQQFYSQWYYSGVRLLTSVDSMSSPQAIAEALRLPVQTVLQVVDFLVQTGLCVENKGRLSIGARSTHVGNDSASVIRHHLNWRMKVMSQMTRPKDHELIFTGPVTLSREARSEVKKRILALIEEWGQIADQSKEEVLCCLNIDWVDIT